MSARVPHVRIVLAMSIIAIAGYAVFSVWVFGWTEDAALKGDVVGTWKSVATLAFGFWLGSSSGGKQQAELPALPHFDIPEPTFGKDEA